MRTSASSASGDGVAAALVKRQTLHAQAQRPAPASLASTGARENLQEAMPAPAMHIFNCGQERAFPLTQGVAAPHQAGKSHRVTSENHCRNPRDEAHVRRICALRPEVETALGLFDHADSFSEPGAAFRAEVVEANVAWRRDLEAQAGESRDRLLDARVFSASLELYKFSDEEVALHKRDPDVVTPLAETLLLHLRGLLPAEPEHRFDSLSRRLKAVRPYLEKVRATSVIEASPELAIRAVDVIDGMPDLLRSIVDAVRTATSGADGSPRSLPASLQAQVEAGVDAFKDGVGGKWGRNKDHRGSSAG